MSALPEKRAGQRFLMMPLVGGPRVFRRAASSRRGLRAPSGGVSQFSALPSAGQRWMNNATILTARLHSDAAAKTTTDHFM